MAFSWYGYNTNETHLTSGYSNPDQWPWMDRMYIRNSRTPLYRTLFNKVAWEYPDADPFGRPRKAARDETLFDDLALQAINRGISLVPILTNLASDGKAYYPEIPAWRTFCQWLSRRYGQNGTFYAERNYTGPARIRFWEVWNEPNTAAYWVNPSAYVNLLIEAAQQIRAGDPNAKIIFGGLAVKAPYSIGTGSIDGDSYLRQVHNAAPSIGSYYQHVGVHHYPRSSDMVGTCINQTLSALDLIKNAGASYGATSQGIWLNEFSVTRRSAEEPTGYGHHKEYCRQMLENLYIRRDSGSRDGPAFWWPFGDADASPNFRATGNGLVAAKRQQYTPAYNAWYSWDGWAGSITPGFAG